MNIVAAHFGNNCEVVLHDLSHVDSSLVAIAGNVTNRSIGAPITNFVLEILQKEGSDAEDRIGYISKTKDGKTLKSSTTFIRNQGEIIGVFCINYCLDDYLMAKNVIENFCSGNTIDRKTNELNTSTNMEFYANNVEEFVENIIKDVLQQEKRKLQMIDKQERLDLVCKLNDKGVFLVKGAIDIVAKRLGSSKYTIYNYLEKLRSRRNI